MDRRPLLTLVVAALLGVLTAWAGYEATRPTAPPASAGLRLVSLSPPITETLFALGAGAHLVGRSSWCTRPPPAMALPDVGSTLAPNLEAIARLAPSHVLTEDVASGRPDDLRAVAHTEVLPWLDLDDVTASVTALGALTGTAPAAAALVGRLRARLDVPPPPDGSRALLVLGGSDLARGDIWVVRDDSLHGRAMNAAGLRNAAADLPPGPPVLSAEALLARDPDLIVVLMAQDDLSPTDRARALAAWQAFPGLSAVASGRVGLLSGADLMSTGPGVLDLVDALSAEVARLHAAAP